MTAVTRPAEARLNASRMMNSSIRCSLTGGQVGWMTKTSCPRIESSILTLISPSAKRRRRVSVRGTESPAEIFSASAGLAEPANSLSSPQGEADSAMYSTAVCTLPIICGLSSRFSPYHPSWNPDGCRAVGHVLGEERSRPRAGALAKFDGRDQHRVHADEGAVPDLRLVLDLAVEVGGDRPGADVGVLAHRRVAQVGDVRHLAAAADRGAHELGEAADVDVLVDDRPRPDLHEGAAVRPVAYARVLYMYVRSNAAGLADHRVALDMGEGLDDGVLADADGAVDEGAGGVGDRDAGRHVAAEYPLSHRRDRPREGGPVVDAHRFVGVIDADDVHRPQVLQHVRQVELARLVVLRDLAQRLDERLPLEAVKADIDLRPGAVARARVLLLHDALESAICAAQDAAVISSRIVDGRDGRLRARAAMRVDHLANGFGGEQRGVGVHDENVAARQNLGGHLHHGVPRAFGLALVDDLSPAVQVGRHLGVMRADDRLDVGRAGVLDRVHHPVDHGATTDWMKHLRSARPHPSAVPGSEDDSR